MRQRKTRAVTEFGDFQTPSGLALAATKVLHGLGIEPRSIVEPTCGRGSFVAAGAQVFGEASDIVGVDINSGYIDEARCALVSSPTPGRVDLRVGNFFTMEWRDVLHANAGPWLILGNPPWVTSAELGSIESDNLPEKSNFHGRTGLEAMTGKSNFDISEWMLLRYLDWLRGAAGTIAVLCKTAVARKTLLHIWTKGYSITSARMFGIDALRHFGAAVEACFLVIEVNPSGTCRSCDIFPDLEATSAERTLGIADGHLISDMRTFTVRRGLLGRDERYVWRSGIKHDCSKVMELKRAGGKYLNGLGELVSLEDTYLFPMLKSSDIGNGRVECRAAMLVPQRMVGEATAPIKKAAPLTWGYLQQHAAALSKRGSSIYRNKPDFSVFGVGSYSFFPWKIAISGFYKKLCFVRVGPVFGRPVVFDDTVNFIACWSEEEAAFVEELLLSEAASEFYQSMIQWDEKRPITVDLLRRLSIRKLAATLGRSMEYSSFASRDENPLMAEAFRREQYEISNSLLSVV